MHIFDRYILSRIIVGTVFGIFCLSAVLLLGQLFKDIKPLIVDQQAPLLQIAKFLWSSIPFMLTFTLPWAFLSAVVLAFGKLSSTNELVGMRMAGWGVYRIAAPVVVLGAVLSAFCFWLNGTVAPRAQHDLQSLLFEAIKQDPQSFLNPGTVQKRLGDSSKLYVQGKEGDTLKGFHFYQLDEKSPFPVSYVYAKEVGVNVCEEGDSLALALSEAYIENRDQETPILMADQAQPWVIQMPQKKKRRRASSMTNAEISKELKEEGDTLTKKRVLKRVKEKTSRQSMAMACLCLGVIGVPLGMQSSRKESNKGFLVALGVAALYFGSLFGLEDASDTVEVRKALIWLPNVFCLIVAYFLYRKAAFS